MVRWRFWLKPLGLVPLERELSDAARVTEDIENLTTATIDRLSQVTDKGPEQRH